MSALHSKFALVAAAATVFCFTASAAPEHSAGKWDPALLELFRDIPIQDGGRVKPLDTFAAFSLLRINGKRSFTTKDGARLTPMEWLLDCLLYPEEAMNYKHFLVDDTEPFVAMGMPPLERRRDRYSYADLEPYLQDLYRQQAEFHEIQAVDPNKLTTTQRLVIDLAGNVQLFQLLTSYFDFATAQPVGDSKLLGKIFEGRDTVTMGEAMAQGGELRKALQAIRLLLNDPSAADNAASYEQEGEKFAQALFGFGEGAYRSVSMALIPPADSAKKQWLTPADFISVSQQGMGGILLDSEDDIDVEGKHLAALERLALNRDNRVAFTQYAKEFRDLSIQRAETRGEYSKIPVEVTFYKGKFFFYAQWLFVFGFVLTALSWLNLKWKALPKVAGVSVFIPWALLVTGITYRCIIRNRPPISTLYETILFITAVAVLVGMVIELINRQKIGLSIASFLGVLGVFIANKFEIVDGQDTMPELQAVLDTNFWLATHVTSVSTGYAAGLLAAAVSNVYIFGRLFGLKKGDPTFYKTLLRMIYGIVCFGLLFSFVGTVLGGIWANYSWGRFWGWDPKENGALLIVLCNIAMLHSRMGGYIKEIGLAMASVFTGSVVAFSWWGVNLLGIGLHSYGFTTGIWGNLLAFWITQGVALLAGAAVLIREHGRNSALAANSGMSTVAK